MKAKQVKALVEVKPKLNCVICNKEIEGFYGRWGKVGTCSRKCEDAQTSVVLKAHLQLQEARFLKEIENAP